MLLQSSGFSPPKAYAKDIQKIMSNKKILLDWVLKQMSNSRADIRTSFIISILPNSEHSL